MPEKSQILKKSKIFLRIHTFSRGTWQIAGKKIPSFFRDLPAPHGSLTNGQTNNPKIEPRIAMSTKRKPSILPASTSLELLSDLDFLLESPWTFPSKAKDAVFSDMLKFEHDVSVLSESTSSLLSTDSWSAEASFDSNSFLLVYMFPVNFLFLLLPLLNFFSGGISEDNFHKWSINNETTFSTFIASCSWNEMSSIPS